MEGKLPCPTDEHGLPLIPENIAICYEVCRLDEQTHNRHHLAHPNSAHKGSLEREYRGVGAMIVKSCICKHGDYHATYRPPRKPSLDIMRRVIAGIIQPQEAPVFIRERP